MEALEVIGPSGGAAASYSFRSFDGEGAFTEMEAHLDKDGALHITGDNMRTTLTVVDSRTMKAHWQKSEDNKTWVPWMELTLSK